MRIIGFLKLHVVEIAFQCNLVFFRNGSSVAAIGYSFHNLQCWKLQTIEIAYVAD
jgi:hypothetical protein